VSTFLSSGTLGGINIRSPRLRIKSSERRRTGERFSVNKLGTGAVQQVEIAVPVGVDPSLTLWPWRSNINQHGFIDPIVIPQVMRVLLVGNRI